VVEGQKRKQLSIPPSKAGSRLSVAVNKFGSGPNDAPCSAFHCKDFAQHFGIWRWSRHPSKTCAAAVSSVTATIPMASPIHSLCTRL